MIDFEIIDNLDKSMINHIEFLAYIERPKYGDYIQVFFDNQYQNFIVHKDEYFYRILNYKITFVDTISFFFNVNPENIILSNQRYEKKKAGFPLKEVLEWSWKKVRKNFEMVKFQILQI